MSEIVTVQLGHYANFVGTHFWNAQDEGNPYQFSPAWQLLYRVSDSRGGDVYHPRLVSVDSEGSLGAMAPDGTFSNLNVSQQNADEQANALGWRGKVELVQQDRIFPGEYTAQMFCDEDQIAENNNDDSSNDPTQQQQQQQQQQTAQGGEGSGSQVVGGNGAENAQSSAAFNPANVKVWTDFLKVTLHPRSVITTPFSHHTTAHHFSTVAQGLNATSSSHTHFGDDLDSRLRYFLEECDRPGAVHVVVDRQSGFGGVAGKVLEMLELEVPKRPIITFSVSDKSNLTTSYERSISALNDLVSMDLFHRMQCPHFPLSTTHLDSAAVVKSCPAFDSTLDLTRAFHSSAILSTFIDSCTLPYRQKEVEKRVSVDSYTWGTLIPDWHRSLLCSSVVVPFAYDSRSGIVPFLQHIGPLFNATSSILRLLPNVEFGTNDEPVLPDSESIVCRGVMPRTPGADLFPEYMEQYYCNRRSVLVHPHPYPISVPHPQFFAPQLTNAGLRHEHPPKASVIISAGEIIDQRQEQFVRQGDVFSMPVIAHAQNSRAVVGMVESVLKVADKNRVNPVAVGDFVNADFSKDEIEDARETMRTLVDDYQDA